eukprot:Polyplicarium_translucidae@DN785_c0_g1_i1.p3
MTVDSPDAIAFTIARRALRVDEDLVGVDHELMKCRERYHEDRVPPEYEPPLFRAATPEEGAVLRSPNIVAISFAFSRRPARMLRRPDRHRRVSEAPQMRSQAFMVSR